MYQELWVGPEWSSIVIHNLKHWMLCFTQWQPYWNSLCLSARVIIESSTMPHSVVHILAHMMDHQQVRLSYVPLFDTCSHKTKHCPDVHWMQTHWWHSSEDLWYCIALGMHWQYIRHFTVCTGTIGSICRSWTFPIPVKGHGSCLCRVGAGNGILYSQKHCSLDTDSNYAAAAPNI